MWPDDAMMVLNSQDDERDQFRKFRRGRALKANTLYFADEAGWFQAENKAANAKRGFRDRRQQTLFIDAQKLVTLLDRVHREPTDADLEKITSTYHTWRRDKGAGKYEDVARFGKSATTADIAAHGHVLTPGRYVGAEQVEEDRNRFREQNDALSLNACIQMCQLHFFCHRNQSFANNLAA